MSIEIERKFLVDPTIFNTKTGGHYAVVGYLSHNEENLSVIRVVHRVSLRKGSLCFKGNKFDKYSRAEYETNIDESMAVDLLNLIDDSQKIRKKRIRTKYEGNDWSVDVFEGNNEGLVLAEIEIPHEDYSFEVPVWAIEEVTNDPRYYNINLVKEPYAEWAENSSQVYLMNNEGILTESDFIKLFQVNDKVYFGYTNENEDFSVPCEIMTVDVKDIDHGQYTFKSTSKPNESFNLAYGNIYNTNGGIDHIWLSSAEQDYRTRNFIVKHKDKVFYNIKNHEFPKGE